MYHWRMAYWSVSSSSV